MSRAPGTNRLTIIIKAAWQLGLEQTGCLAWYRIGLLSGLCKRLTPGNPQPLNLEFQPLFELPSPKDLTMALGDEGRRELLVQAQEVVDGQVRLFGDEPVPLILNLAPMANKKGNASTTDKAETSSQIPALQHWTDYELNPSLIAPFLGEMADVKFLWEPARFGWAFILGRAWNITRDEHFAQAFWEYTEAFLQTNPPCLGPNWVSGQEVAIRLMALAWCRQVFDGSLQSSPERKAWLNAAIAAHAVRLPASLAYARSQNNNHLLSEAAGLLSAGLALPGHPQSARWRRLGWKWLKRGFYRQIDAYGEHSQHSSNYQRLVLQLALWVKSLSALHGLALPRKVKESLSLATHWLLSILDPQSGEVPNLGGNDGALIFPLTTCPQADHRPVLQAAARAFLGYTLPCGAWDEMALWFNQPPSRTDLMTERYPGDAILGRHSWAYLRAARLRNRPSHADQLHLDLWWRGLNIARDTGTYLYNVDPPWDNALAGTRLHNTLTVDGQDQMTPVGRFLFLDWAQAKSRQVIEADEAILQRSLAWHDGYHRLGVRHERQVTGFRDERWLVEDRLLFIKVRHPQRTFRLHCLLPDWEWRLENENEGWQLGLKSPQGWITLVISCDQPGASFSLSRAGVSLFGPEKPQEIDGWYSPTYGLKQPALSLACQVDSQADVNFTSQFLFPDLP